MPIDLFYNIVSPPCRSVLMLADTIGIQFNFLEMDRSRPDHLKAELVAANPQHTIPTIVDNGFSVWESRAILIYLAEKYDKTNTLYPKDIQMRATINQKLFFDLELAKKFSDYFYPQVMAREAADPAKLQKLVDGLGFLNTALQGKDYVAGNDLTVADIALITTLTGMEAAKIDFAQFENLIKYMTKCKESISGYNKMAQQSLDRLLSFVDEILKKE